MMKINFEKLDLKFLKDALVSYQVLFVVAIATTCFLFLPEKISQLIISSSFKAKWTDVITIIWLVNYSILIVRFTSAVFIYLNKRIKILQHDKNRTKMLNQLTVKEKEIILRIYETQENALLMPIDSGVTKKLTNYSVISPTRKEVYVNARDPQQFYFLQPWVIEYVQKNPELFTI